MLTINERLQFNLLNLFSGIIYNFVILLHLFKHVKNIENVTKVGDSFGKHINLMRSNMFCLFLFFYRRIADA